jgi:hypothetical protein
MHLRILGERFLHQIHDQIKPYIGDRGRDAGYPAPPAQIRTCPIKAYGSYLGYLTAIRSSGHG